MTAGPVTTHVAAAARPTRVRIARNGARLGVESALRRRGLGPVAGVDEAGRGACAGPLVVAACILPDRIPAALTGLDDSKKLSRPVRERFADALSELAVAVSVVIVPPADIDARGIHRCNLDGMRRAVAGLSVRPGFVLTDGFAVDGFGCQSTAVIKGDAAIASIAAASVVAKVTRDRLMVDLDRRFPGYGIARHKGYPAAAHTAAIENFGPTAMHRTTYANVRRAAAAYLRSQH